MLSQTKIQVEVTIHIHYDFNPHFTVYLFLTTLDGKLIDDANNVFFSSFHVFDNNNEKFVSRQLVDLGGCLLMM